MTRLIRTGAGSGSSKLLARILERSELVAAVPKLSPPLLGQLIEHVGLEDAGELVAVASTQQLERVWDQDLWSRAEPASEERFDPERFALWLTVMAEAGEAQLVRRLREVPFDLLTLAVHRLVHVVDRERWLDGEGQGGEDEDASGLHAPWQEFVLVARDGDAWASVLAALLALDEEDHALLRRLLERCRDLDVEARDYEEDAYQEAFGDEEALEHDVAAEREQRRAGTGFVSESDARSFLELARVQLEGDPADWPRDPVASTYFRELDDGSLPAGTPAEERDERAAGDAATTALTAATSESSAVASLLELLAESGVLAAPATPLAALPAPSASEPSAAGPKRAAPKPPAALLRSALQSLAESAPASWSLRMEELAFVANVLSATGEDGGSPLSPTDSLEAAAVICDLGLELQLDARGVRKARGRRAEAVRLAAAVDVLRRVSADRLFRAGYAALHADRDPPGQRARLRRTRQALERISR